MILTGSLREEASNSWWVVFFSRGDPPHILTASFGLVKYGNVLRNQKAPQF